MEYYDLEDKLERKLREAEAEPNQIGAPHEDVLRRKPAVGRPECAVRDLRRREGRKD